MLDHESEVPLYLQLRDHLRSQIDSGVYTVGMRLPSERELAETCSVSRMTARMALQALIQDGLIRPRVGKGTYVSKPKFNQQLHSLTSFTQEIHGRGLRPASRVLVAELRHADAETAENLALKTGDDVIVLARIRLAEEKPLALEIAHLNPQLFPALLTDYDFNHLSLYSVLRNDFGIHMTRAEQIIEARLPTPYEREALEIGKYEPVLSLRRTTFSDQDQRIEYVRSVYNGAAYQLRATLSAQVEAIESQWRRD